MNPLALPDPHLPENTLGPYGRGPTGPHEAGARGPGQYAPDPRRSPLHADAPGAAPRTMYAWFADTAARHADAPALEAEGRTVRYAELAALVERSARAVLRAHGGRPPARLALLTTRTVAAYAGYLAAQRVGACVVPLNPDYPPDRNQRVLRAAGGPLVLTDGPHLARAVALTGADRIVDLTAPAADAPDADQRPVDRQPADDPSPEPGAGLPPVPADLDATAYLLFTSGSTGSPKGVPVTHRSVDAYLRHVVGTYGLGPGARVPNTADLTFDISVFELFGSWGSGATLVAPREQDDLIDPVRFVNECALTHWHSVPSVISIARRLRRLPPGGMPDLRCSLFIGEALTLTQAAAWADASPNAALHNLYGPTEATVMCSGYALPRRRGDWPATANGTVPIGPLFPGTEHLVVNAEGKPCEDGELLLRGVQVFAGYLDPADNAGRFALLDASGAAVTTYDREVTGEHWYRTGDRVRTEHGVLVHRGRLDHQLKIHGFRVELGEIEATLRQDPGVGDAVVLPLGGGSGDVDLIALYTGDPDAEPRLRELARRRLPAFMHPRRYQAYERFPLNANGKTDRGRLADLVAAPSSTPQDSR